MIFSFEQDGGCESGAAVGADVRGARRPMHVAAVPLMSLLSSRDS